MAKLRHIAIATKDPDATAEFYKKHFEMKEVGTIENDLAEGVYLSDGVVNLAVIKMRSRWTNLPGEDINFTGIHHFGFIVEDLEESIRIHRDVPPIIFANIGTTMREGVDDIPAIQGILKNLAIPQSYIHADAALCGMTLPFIDGAPEFNFSTGIHSMSISGHKLIGSPLPCGVVLALKAHVDLIARSIEYVGTLDTTITGSRNAITPLMLWHAIRSQGVEGFRAIVVECLACAEYAVEQLNAIGVAAWRNPYAITVVLPKPTAVVLDKWQLAVEEDIAHIMVMPHVDRDRIDRIVADIAANPV